VESSGILLKKKEIIKFLNEEDVNTKSILAMEKIKLFEMLNASSDNKIEILLCFYKYVNENRDVPECLLKGSSFILFLQAISIWNDNKNNPKFIIK